MKTILYQLEITMWNTHIRILDESKFVQNMLPHLREIWLQRKKIANALGLSLLGLPLGIFLGVMK